MLDDGGQGLEDQVTDDGSQDDEWMRSGKNKYSVSRATIPESCESESVTRGMGAETRVYSHTHRETPPSQLPDTLLLIVVM